MSPHPYRHLWPLRTDVAYLNHGSYGATPRVVLERQQQFRDELEREPIDFLKYRYEPLLDAARLALSTLVGCDTDGLAFVPNATQGLNAVVNSIPFTDRDTIVFTDHEYNATRNIIEAVGRRSNCRLTMVPLPFPGLHPDIVLERILGAITDSTRLVVIDHVTSQSGAIMPVTEICRFCRSRGVEVLIDGAHAPGMIPLKISELGAQYYVGNCHKWLCAPKGAGFLWVAPERRADIRPIAVSHGANSTRTDRSRYHLEFDWTGTFDPSAILCVPEAVSFMAGLVDGGWPAVVKKNRTLVLEARRVLLGEIVDDAPVAESMIGAMTSFLIRASNAATVHRRLRNDFSLEVLTVDFPKEGKVTLRVSAQLYNTIDQYAALRDALVTCGYSET